MSLINEMQVNTLDQLILTCIEQPAFASWTKEPFGQSIVKYAVDVVEETSVSNSYFSLYVRILEVTLAYVYSSDRNSQEGGMSP